jgi:hypothetical protein
VVHRALALVLKEVVFIFSSLFSLQKGLYTDPHLPCTIVREVRKQNDIKRIRKVERTLSEKEII